MVNLFNIVSGVTDPPATTRFTYNIFTNSVRHFWGSWYSPPPQIAVISCLSRGKIMWYVLDPLDKKCLVMALDFVFVCCGKGAPRAWPVRPRHLMLSQLLCT